MGNFPKQWRILGIASACNSMAAKGLESFLAQVEQEPSLQEQLSKLDLQGVLNLAKEQGFEVRAFTQSTGGTDSGDER